MKKSMRLALTAAVLMSAGTLPVFATVGGTNPRPPASTGGNSTADVVVAAVLSALGL